MFLFFKSGENGKKENIKLICVHYFLRIFKINRLRKCTLINKNVNRRSYFVKLDQKCTLLDMKQYYRINVKKKVENPKKKFCVP